jgi:hypothetical protein
MGQCSCISIKKRPTTSSTSITERQDSDSFYEIIQTDEILATSTRPKLQQDTSEEISILKQNEQESDSSSDVFASLKNQKNALKRKTYAAGYLEKVQTLRRNSPRYSDLGQHRVVENFFMTANQSFDSFHEQDLSIEKIEEREILRKFFLSKNREIQKQGSLKSKRLTGYHKAEIIMKELLSSSINTSKPIRKDSKDSPNQPQRLQLLRKPSISSLYSQDLETLNLSKILSKSSPTDNILIFSVPFKKQAKLNFDYNMQSFDFSTFNRFYKTSEIKSEVLKKENLYIQLLDLFPSRWELCIPFVIDKQLLFLSNSSNSPIYNVVMESFHDIQKNTVLKFVSYSRKKHQSFLFFTLGHSNSSFIGRHEGKNLVILKKNAKKADILHQIMHCLGFMHMHFKSNNEFFSYLCKDQVRNENLLPDNKNVCIFGVEFGPLDFNSVLYCNSCSNMISFVDRDDLDSLSLSPADYAKINFFYDPCNFSASEEVIRQKLHDLRMVSNSSGNELKFNLRNK